MWNSVYDTDRSQTKSFQRKGGFRGTAVNPLELVRKATELWGPMGIGWGCEEVGNPDVRSMPNGDIVVNIRVRLWYGPRDEAGNRCWVEGWGGTVLYDSGRGYTDDDAFKKSYTDAMSVAFSRLGFAADIRLGFNENKYTTEDTRTTSPARTTTARKTTPNPDVDMSDKFDAAKSAIESTDNTKELMAIGHRVEEVGVSANQRAELESLIRSRATDIRNATTA